MDQVVEHDRHAGGVLGTRPPRLETPSGWLAAFRRVVRDVDPVIAFMPGKCLQFVHLAWMGEPLGTSGWRLAKGRR